MLKLMCAIRDQKTREFLHPFTETNEETAAREFYNALSQIPTMSQHPQDFDLYEIGEYQTEDGTLFPSETVQFLINGLDCVKNIQRSQQDAEKEQTSTE